MQSVAEAVLYQSQRHQSPVAQPLIMRAYAAAQTRAAAATATMRISDAALELREKRVPFNTAVEGAAGGIQGGDEHVGLAFHDARDDNARATTDVLM